MTALLDTPLEIPDEPDPDAVQELEDDEVLAPAALALAVVSGALSAAGAAWMIGGIFRGSEARLVGLLGVLLGSALVFASSRWRAPVLGYLVLPAALLLGAVLMSSSSGGGTSSLPSLVRDAVSSSQLLQPPIDTAPGWRLILVVLLALLASSACALALSLRRPRLAVVVPAPLTVAAALVQPAGSAITTGAVSVGFVMMALATSFAADGAGETFDRGFELRRLARSLVAGVLLVAGLVAASQVSFLFPEQDATRVVPPRRPPVSPPQPDVPLYTVKGELPGPLRVGVIDVYDLQEQAWLLPPVDSSRLQRLTLPADLPDAPTAAGPVRQLTVTVQQARGRTLPTLAGTQRVEADGTVVDHDPRTQGLALVERPVFTGLRYTLAAPPAPDGRQLSAATGEVPQQIRQFLEAPPVPPAVEALLSKAPEAPFARLQTVRTALYKEFVAKGQGRPTDVSADRVVELLGGGTGNPYELTAAEALLARWAGVPSRIGFGYFEGAPVDGETEFRPADAATFLEVHLAPYGWVPIVGTPPKAQQSLSDNQRDDDPSIQASPELGIEVFLPVRRPDGLPLYTYVRFYLVRTLPVVAGAGLLLLLYPVLLKRVRSRRRAAWAREHGPAGAVAVAYCELRDRMLDLALPGRGCTPLELVEVVAEDEEHAELSWLVTRGLWGDLRGTLTTAEADDARRLAASVGDRLASAQPGSARLLGAVSRASLRAPYSQEVPNVWWQPRVRGLAGRVLAVPGRALRRAARRTRRAPRLGTASTSVLALLAVLTLGGCSGGGPAPEPSVAFPTRIAPTAVAGLVAREESEAARAYETGAADRDVIVSRGSVVSFSRDGLVQAALQVAQLKPGYVASDDEVVEAITRSVGDVDRLDPQSGLDLYVLADGSQQIYVWFPTVKSMALLVVRSQIGKGAAEALARGLVDYGQGGEIDEAALAAALAAVPSSPASPPSPGSTPSPEVTP